MTVSSARSMRATPPPRRPLRLRRARPGSRLLLANRHPEPRECRHQLGWKALPKRSRRGLLTMQRVRGTPLTIGEAWGGVSARLSLVPEGSVGISRYFAIDMRSGPIGPMVPAHATRYTLLCAAASRIGMIKRCDPLSERRACADKPSCFSRLAETIRDSAQLFRSGTRIACKAVGHNWNGI